MAWLWWLENGVNAAMYKSCPPGRRQVSSKVIKEVMEGDSKEEVMERSSNADGVEFKRVSGLVESKEISGMEESGDRGEMVPSRRSCRMSAKV